jgi:hypothetical protein
MTPTIKSGAAAVLLMASMCHPHSPLAAADEPSQRPADTSGPPLSAHVYPRVSRAPALVRVMVRVEPAPGNRALQIVIDSESYYRSSTIELSAENAPRTHTIEFRHVPVGVHDVDVSLIGSAGSVRAIVRDRVLILD